MKLNLYSVYDEVAGDSMPPFTAVNDGLAMRMFENSMVKMVKDSGIDNRSDFKLYRVGAYGTEKQKIVAEAAPVRVIKHEGIENGSE